MAVQQNGSRILLGIAAIAVSVYFIMSMNSFLFASEYFKVTEIEVIDKYQDEIEYPIARIKDNPNIFKVNLDKISKNLEREYSNIQKAIVKRILPNKLKIEILRRSPVAQIALSAENGKKKFYFFSVNDDSYILANLGVRPKRKLPIIYGTELNVNDIEVGRSYEDSNLGRAVSLINELKSTGFLKRYKITKLDVTNVRSMSFFIKNRLEVKIGDRDWRRRIANLTSILQNMDISEHEYIDLRFKEIVFGKKNDEK
ncbi:MAG: FtsQ-type POTRA domain-containing protein [PVC group bacterium]|nr:FtsQ-type POTRA domain-containing protein [PVC group bacterium]